MAGWQSVIVMDDSDADDPFEEVGCRFSSSQLFIVHVTVTADSCSLLLFFCSHSTTLMCSLA